MNIHITGEGAFSAAVVELEAGERFLSESGAMYRASSNIDIDVTTRTRGSGGVFAGLKRLLASEHFFLSTYSLTSGASGEVGLAPTLQGEVKALELDGSIQWLCASGSYMGSTSELTLNTQFQGFKGMFSGESLFFVEVSGVGTLLVSAFGRIVEIDVQDELIVDTGHVVAYEETLSYTVGKAGGGWVHSFLGGEGLVLHFKGRGKVLTQSHNPAGFGGVLGAMLPPRQQ